MAYLDDTATRRANLTFMRQAMRLPLLEREDERALAQRWRDDGDQVALHRLVNAHGRLVVAAAHKFRHYGLPLGDLMQEGQIGLLQAAERFEADRDVRFSTYAGWWIRAAMQDYVLRNWSIVRTGTTAAQKTLFFNLRRLRRKLGDAEGKLSTAGFKKVAATLGVTVEDVKRMDGRLQGGDFSLNQPVRADSAREAQDFIPDDRPSPEVQVMHSHDRQVRHRWLHQALATLDQRERQIILHRRLGDESMTLEDLGDAMGVSKERVRQLESRAMDKLRQELSRHVTDTSDLWHNG